MKLLSAIAISCNLFISFSLTASAQMSLVPFVNNVTKVTDITNCNDDRLFIVEQAGRIRISDLDGNLLPTPFLSITLKVNDNGNEQGLLGMAFSPNFKQDGRFYLNYTNSSNATIIARYKVSATDPNVADSVNEEILLQIAQPYTNHNGGTMQFGPDGYLYIGLGDGGAGGDPGNRAQNLQSPLGKILRIDVAPLSSYLVPVTNPFYGSTTAYTNIWSYGLRNPWRMSFDKLTGDLWIGDVGQNIIEEINFQPASSTGGENYGWRCYEANAIYDSTCVFPLTSYSAPVFTYSHFPGCSVTGGYVYRGAKYSSWYGKYFFTDFCSGLIQSLTPNDSGGFSASSYGSFGNYIFSTFGVDRYGEMYVGKNTTGVLKLTDSSCVPVAFISMKDTIFLSGTSYLLSTPYAPGLKYQWLLNGKLLAASNSHEYTAQITGNYQVLVTDSGSCFNLSKITTLVLNKGDGFEMYPNPAGDYTELVWSSSFSKSKKIEVFDGTGKLVKSAELNPKELNYLLSTKTFNQGIYLVRMTIEEELFVKKLMVN